jgi:hypothetical protein
MKKIRNLVLFGLSLGITSCLTLPTSTVTRTHLMKDIDKSTITAVAGIELELTEDTEYIGDSLFGYFSYAPWDWLEFGIAGHALNLGLYPSVDAKIDAVDIFSDSRRLSLLLMGGIGGLPDDLFFYHGGLTMNYRPNPNVQLYLGAGSDSIAEALVFQAGAYFIPMESLGIFANFKLVTGRDGTELMFSMAPSASFGAGKAGSD